MFANVAKESLLDSVFFLVCSDHEAKGSSTIVTSTEERCYETFDGEVEVSRNSDSEGNDVGVWSDRIRFDIKIGSDHAFLFFDKMVIWDKAMLGLKSGWNQ